jgi:hypothetical protein
MNLCFHRLMSFRLKNFLHHLILKELAQVKVYTMDLNYLLMEVYNLVLMAHYPMELKEMVHCSENLRHNWYFLEEHNMFFHQVLFANLHLVLLFAQEVLIVHYLN